MSKYTNVGTEGHPDHGKSKLMAGTDCYVGWDKALEGGDTSVTAHMRDLLLGGFHEGDLFMAAKTEEEYKRLYLGVWEVEDKSEEGSDGD